MRTTWMNPSGMSNVLGACDPVTLVDRNLALINEHFGLAIAPTTTTDSDGASAVLQAAFTTLAGALNLTFFPVTGSRDPEAAVQANFELINAHW